MPSKKNIKATTSGAQPPLKIGSRVRCTDDRVEGRIVWANGTSVKIQWDDGEQVTWRRDALASKPIEILDTDAVTEEGLHTEAPRTDLDSEQIVPTALPQAESDTMPAATEQAAMPEVSVEPTLLAPEQPQAATDGSVAEPVSPAPEQTPAAPADSAPTPMAPAKPKRQRKAPAEPKEKKVSALDAAARGLAEEGRPMTCKEMIETMAAKGYWTSPGGQPPKRLCIPHYYANSRPRAPTPGSSKSIAASSPATALPDLPVATVSPTRPPDAGPLLVGADVRARRLNAPCANVGETVAFLSKTRPAGEIGWRDCGASDGTR
jgi:hypothetical protein